MDRASSDRSGKTRRDLKKGVESRASEEENEKWVRVVRFLFRNEAKDRSCAAVCSLSTPFPMRSRRTEMISSLSSGSFSSKDRSISNFGRDASMESFCRKRLVSMGARKMSIVASLMDGSSNHARWYSVRFSRKPKQDFSDATTPSFGVPAKSS